MINNLKAIVFKVKDFKEKDKLLQAFSLEYGLIDILVKNVKSNNSKVKWLCQPFCFAEVKLSELGNYYLLTSANLIDNFYDICLDIDKLYLLSNLILIIEKILPAKEPNPILFLNLIKVLKFVNYDSMDYKIVYIKFLLDLLNNLGYQFNLDFCAECKNAFLNDRYLNINNGEIVCKNCCNVYDLKISNKVYNYIHILNNTEFECLLTVKIDVKTLEELCLFLESYFKIFYNVNFIKY